MIYLAHHLVQTERFGQSGVSMILREQRNIVRIPWGMLATVIAVVTVTGR